MNSSKPRVVIDSRMVGPEGHGIASYVLHLAQGLAKLDLTYEPCYLIHTSCPLDSPLRALPHAESEIPFLHPKEVFRLGAEIARMEPALYHSPSFASLPSYPCRHLQTVHDLNHLHFGGWKEKAYYYFLLRSSLRSAAGVFSVSQAAANEIESWLESAGIPRKVELAPNPILPFPCIDTGLLSRLGLSAQKYFFCLSNPKPHKNLDFLLEAYRQARLAEPDLPPLVLSVSGKSTGGILNTGPLSPSDIGFLLKNACAFFFPSLYEGFGRPPLEAALLGTPPWVSDIPAHREALSGVSEAQFLPLGNTQAWVDAFRRSIRDHRSVSVESRTWIERTYSEERLASVMDAAYNKTLHSEESRR